MLQLANIIIGLFVTFYIARNVAPETFSLYAISMIVSTIFVTFSFLGFESVLLRNLLYWKELGKNRKIVNYVSYAIFSRLFASGVLFFPVSIYLLYLSATKYNGEHWLLFSFYMVSGSFSALNNANGLIFKALNQYITSFTVTTLSSVCGRLVAAFFFAKYGFEAFIGVIVLIPIVSFFISVLFLKDYIDIKQVRFKYFFKFRKLKYFIFSGYSNYFKTSVDQVLVSIFLSSEILAVYNLARRVEEIGRSFVAGFFEPITQRLIKYKGKIEHLESQANKVFKIRNYSIIVICILTIIFSLSSDIVIALLGLENYEYLNVYIIISAWSSFLYILYKVESHIICLFDEPKVILSIDVLVSLLSVTISVLVFYFTSEEFVYLNRLILGVVLLAIYALYFKYKFKYFVK
ncbi:oligosaccharide flippase family protein [Vibrio parahaemolyticus]|nr:oligosaccharide flippase family protein [Vibrio parahaemolyticus]ELB2164206.1 oligosaccharide flippase family protein [Vibrio parahaemolyticus]ELB2191307.1 oligosaccharide flippase family protein [Vibrio parahaemolyticus]ELB2211911.1 oligosaccharide flippase family protein [Vibrio parahaemolyticus]ELB2231764.1 oligosaccharide flippase family protein [Vibrio parahaemolyticus]